MKHMMVMLALSVLGSSASFALGSSEYERGFNDGVASCVNSQKVIACTIKASSSYPYVSFEENGYGVGASIEEAKNAAIANCEKNFLQQYSDYPSALNLYREEGGCAHKAAFGYITCQRID